MTIFLILGASIGIACAITGIVVFVVGTFKQKTVRRRRRRRVAQSEQRRRTLGQVAADLTPNAATELRADGDPAPNADAASPSAPAQRAEPAPDEGGGLAGSLGDILRAIIRIIVRSFGIVFATGKTRRRYQESQRNQAAGVFLITVGAAILLATGIIAALAAVTPNGGTDDGGAPTTTTTS